MAGAGCGSSSCPPSAAASAAPCACFRPSACAACPWPPPPVCACPGSRAVSRQASEVVAHAQQRVAGTAARRRPRRRQPQCASPLPPIAVSEAPRTCSCPLPLRGCALLKAATAGRLPAKEEDLHCGGGRAMSAGGPGSPAEAPTQRPHAPAGELPAAAAQRRLHGCYCSSGGALGSQLAISNVGLGWVPRWRPR